MHDISTYVQTGVSIIIFIVGNYLLTIRGIKKLIVQHERADEKRHRQNLARFGWIGASLARLGNQTDMPTFEDD